MYQYPVNQPRVTRSFGVAGAYACGWHIGTDIVSADGSHDIYAISGGTVEQIGGRGLSYGNHLTIKHPDGLVSLYAHLSLILVKQGQAVNAGDRIGIMGATGNANGVHLHLELQRYPWRYPAAGTTTEKCSWIINPIAWIEDHIGTPADAPSAWAADAWEWCSRQGLLDGTRPHDSVTREELAVVLQRFKK